MLNVNKIRQLLASVIVLAGLSLAVAIFLKVHRGEPAKPVTRMPGNVDMSLQKIHFTETKDGVKKWDLTAERAAYDKGREMAHLTGIRLVVPGDHATGDITLTSDRADYNMATRDVHLAGNVAASSSSGMRFTTDQAVFKADASVVRSEGRVSFSDGSVSLEGSGMQFSTVTRDIRISRDVTASIRPKGAR